MEKLRRIGMSADGARAKGALFARCDDALPARAGRGRRWSIWVPGRIEVLGKHTDYAGGRSLVCALERGICARATPRADAIVRVTDVAHGVTLEIPLDVAAGQHDDWGTYVAAAARRLVRNFPMVTRGVDFAFASDLPAAAGMSSSSALVITTFIALAKSNDLRSTPEFRETISSREELASYLGCMESGADFRGLTGDAGVGTLGGSQDHTAILCSDAGRIARYAWSPVRREESIPLPRGHLFAIASSGVAAVKTGGARSAYNRASLAVRRLLQLWNGHTYRNDASLAEAVASLPDARERLRRIAAGGASADFTAGELEDRLEHFLLESEVIIPAAARSLSEHSLGAFGAYVEWSQWATERLLGNQIPETVHLARSARAIGAVAASAFGAGFGGSVWALVRAADAPAFVRQWEAEYRQAHPERAADARFFTSAAGPAAFQW